MKNNIRCLALVGHQKCGTRYIMKAIKESGAFDILSRKEIDSRIEKQLTFQNKINTGYLYADHPTALSEKNPIFLLKKLYPETKALVIYRNPVDVMISMHKYLRVGRKQYTQGEMKDVGLYKGKPIFCLI